MKYTKSDLYLHTKPHQKTSRPNKLKKASCKTHWNKQKNKNSKYLGQKKWIFTKNSEKKFTINHKNFLKKTKKACFLFLFDYNKKYKYRKIEIVV